MNAFQIYIYVIKGDKYFQIFKLQTEPSRMKIEIKSSKMRQSLNSDPGLMTTRNYNNYTVNYLRLS